MQDNQNTRKLGEGFLSLAIIILLIHLYYFCRGAIVLPGIPGKIADSLMEKIVHTGLFNHWAGSKFFSLVLLFGSLLAQPVRKDVRVSYSSGLIWLGIGAAIYFVPLDWITILGLEPPRNWIGYAITTGVGFVVQLTGISRLQKAFYSHGDFFAENRSGFEQEQHHIATEHSLHLKTRFAYNGKKRKGEVNIVNPRRGIVVMGSPGCGKTRYVIEPAIAQFLGKGMSMLVYDLKFPELTAFTYRHFMQQKHVYPPNARFCCINFTDPSLSNRCNVIDPRTLNEFSDAVGVAKAILTSMNRNWAKKEGEFFVESPISFVACLIWYLRQYKDGIYCTLPHVIELSCMQYDELFTLLNAEESTRVPIATFVDAYLHNSMEMLEGQLASARVPLSRLASPGLYYVLTGNDFSLAINDPAAPVVLCLGGDQSRKEMLASLLSVYIDRLNRLVNKPGGRPTALVLDEFSSVRAYSVLDTIATGRSNNISVLLSFQDASQLRSLYSDSEARQILDVVGNVICGAVGGDTARWMSEKFLPLTGYKTTVSVNSQDSSISKSEHSEPAMSASMIANLSSGEFVGILGDDPDVKLTIKAFHGVIVRAEDEDPEPLPLPVVRDVTQQDLADHFKQIKKEIYDLIETEMTRIERNPALKRWIVRKS